MFHLAQKYMFSLFRPFSENSTVRRKTTTESAIVLHSGLQKALNFSAANNKQGTEMDDKDKQILRILEDVMGELATAPSARKSAYQKALSGKGLKCLPMRV